MPNAKNKTQMLIYMDSEQKLKLKELMHINRMRNMSELVRSWIDENWKKQGGSGK